MGVDWRDQKTVDAIRAYVRVAFGIAFAAIVLYMMLNGQIDPVAVLKALASVLALGRVTDGVLLMIANKTTS